MKKSVLIALLGLTTTEAMKVEQKEESSSKNQEQNDVIAKGVTAENGYELVQAISELETK
jgi:hypothetical protein